MNAHSDEPQAREQYAEELIRRYRELRRWAVENWPNTAQPLEASDFVATDRELQLLLGARLHPGLASGRQPAKAQYEDVTPMPWP
ncbi:hypothetical protein [Herbaspirillum sp. RV1423]|uniref:hypothetical protein n=1 Tax=Herbaspirillum sp. RV1423 TaxID=1443993 RepID=UPI0004BAF68A|nr:hypothetical protein [Herbaspirillum sp. RV1423]